MWTKETRLKIMWYNFIEFSERYSKESEYRSETSTLEGLILNHPDR